MDWLDELKREEIDAMLNKDMALVAQECGIKTAKILWEKLSGLNIYVSEKSLFDLKRLYIRRYHNPLDPHCDKKALAVKLGVSEEFVKKALATVDDKNEPRQEKLL